MVDNWDDGVNVCVCYEVVSGNGILLFNIDVDSGNVIVGGMLNVLGLYYVRVRV